MDAREMLALQIVANTGCTPEVALRTIDEAFREIAGVHPTGTCKGSEGKPGLPYRIDGVDHADPRD